MRVLISIMNSGGFVYIMANQNHAVLYVGVTADLAIRIRQHLMKANPKAFVSKYRLFKLLYYKSFTTIKAAIAEEKRIKGGSRLQKMSLIKSLNPQFKDLWLSEVSKW